MFGFITCVFKIIAPKRGKKSILRFQTKSWLIKESVVTRALFIYSMITYSVDLISRYNKSDFFPECFSLKMCIGEAGM